VDRVLGQVWNWKEPNHLSKPKLLAGYEDLWATPDAPIVCNESRKYLNDFGLQ
jgi:hypothetical protein